MGIEGICVLEGSVKGTIKISQEADGKPCTLTGTIEGLTEGIINLCRCIAFILLLT